MKKILLLLFCALVISLLIAGCSKRGKNQSKNAMNEKVWIIVTDVNFPPFTFEDNQKKPVGIDIELLEAIANDQGFNYRLLPLGWQDATHSVQNGQVEGIISAMSVKEERIKQGWCYSNGYFKASQTFAVPIASPITSLAELKGKKVAAKEGTASMAYVQSIEKQYGFTIVPSKNSKQMLTDLEAGLFDACVDDAPFLSYALRHGAKIKLPPKMENEASPYAFAIIDKKYQPLLDKFNAGLINIRANGTYQKILDKYLK